MKEILCVLIFCNKIPALAIYATCVADACCGTAYPFAMREPKASKHQNNIEGYEIMKIVFRLCRPITENPVSKCIVCIKPLKYCLNYQKFRFARNKILTVVPL